MRSVTVAVEGIAGMDQLIAALPNIDAAIGRIVRSTTKKAHAMSRDDLMSRVNFPANYLKKPDRLEMILRASGRQTTGVIKARQRGTGLASFIVSRMNVPRGREDRARELMLRIIPGRVVGAGRAFLMVGRNDNRLLAVNTGKNGEDGKYVWTDKRGNKIRILYGPSVDQVFRKAAPDLAPKVSTEMAGDFIRLIENGVSK